VWARRHHERLAKTQTSGPYTEQTNLWSSSAAGGWTAAAAGAADDEDELLDPARDAAAAAAALLRLRPAKGNRVHKRDSSASLCPPSPTANGTVDVFQRSTTTKEKRYDRNHVQGLRLATFAYKCVQCTASIADFVPKPFNSIICASNSHLLCGVRLTDEICGVI
jgi:hypothetical protein